MSNEAYQTFKEWPPLPDLLSATALRPTAPDILGPFFRPGSPFRTTLCANPNLFLTGTVRDTRGKLLVGVYVDFWQADVAGRYDEFGPGFRGIQQTDGGGRYHLETVRPGAYDISEPSAPQPHEFRCAHVHAKVWVGGKDVLTTQLYFRDDPHDATDHWFSPDRVITFGTDPSRGTFDFVVKV